MSVAELPRLLAIVLVVFDNEQGGQVAYEVPEGSVGCGDDDVEDDAARGHSLAEENAQALDALGEDGPPTASLLTAGVNAARHAETQKKQDSEPLFQLDTVSAYIMPARPIVRHLVTICVDKCKVLGFPVWIDSSSYPRGRFMYNVCFVFERNAELTAYEPVVRKTGRVLRHMEESTHLLSDPAQQVRVCSILEQIYEDLGSYSETSIPLDACNTLDLKLFPQNPNPAVVSDWDIPVPLIHLDTVRDESWDVTMYSLAGYIDGTRSVKRIANMADVEMPLARECIQHLLYYGCIILHDLFQFTNSYAICGEPASLGALVGDFSQSLQRECEGYVSITSPVTPFAILYGYYAKLRPGLTLEDWIDTNNIDTDAIDVRRMISFGVIKGFIRRVFAYPVWLDHPSFHAAQRARQAALRAEEASRGRKKPMKDQTPGQLTPTSIAAPALAVDISTDIAAAVGSLSTAAKSPGIKSVKTQLQSAYPPELPNLLDGEHSTDELCVRFRVSFRQLKAWLAVIGNATDSAINSRRKASDALGNVKLIYV